MFRWQLTPDGAVDISERAEAPWDRFDPWYEHGQIPVPGFWGMQSVTVAGIMESMKCIGEEGKRGKISLGYLVGGRRTREIPEGHWMTGYQVKSSRGDLTQARRDVFVPAYQWVLRNKVSEQVARLRVLGQKDDVAIYDGLENADLEDPRPLSYGALLCAYLNRDVDRFCGGGYVPYQ